MQTDGVHLVLPEARHHPLVVGQQLGWRYVQPLSTPCTASVGRQVAKPFGVNDIGLIALCMKRLPPASQFWSSTDEYVTLHGPCPVLLSDSLTPDVQTLLSSLLVKTFLRQTIPGSALKRCS